MEIVFRNDKDSETINISNSIISLQSKDDLIKENLKEDYEVVEIDNTNLYFVSDTVLNEITLFTKFPELSLISDIMQIIGIDYDFFDRKIYSLSNTEKIFLNIFRNIAKSFDIAIFNNIFLGLDNNNRKKVTKIIDYLKDNSYCVIICSDDVNDLYKHADYSVLGCKTNIICGKSEDIYSNIEELNRYKLQVPTLSYITYKAKKDKKIKLFYSRDVRDIIKDIYKHV